MRPLEISQALDAHPRRLLEGISVGLDLLGTTNEGWDFDTVQQGFDT
jgi:hypothetical protein